MQLGYFQPFSFQVAPDPLGFGIVLYANAVVRGGMTIITAFLPTLYMEATPDQPWLDALYTLGYRPFYTNGVKLHPPRPLERQNDVLLVHDTKIDRLAALIEI